MPNMTSSIACEDFPDEEIPDAIPLVNPTKKEWKPVPVTVITGFLGAGKTTLVNYVLTAQHGYRIAVILNEYGSELDIERALVAEDDGTNNKALVEEWVELGNGCICCSTKHNFVQTLEALMEKRDKFDQILIETTGLANPAPIVSVLWMDDELEAGVSLDSIVTVVDALNLTKQLERDGPENEALLQIAFADTIILNKVDLLSKESTEQAEEKEIKLENVRLSNQIFHEVIPKSVDEGKLSELESKIRQINAMAKIVKSVRCQVDLDFILNSHSYSKERISELENLVKFDEDKGHIHIPSVSSVGFWTPGTVDLEKVNNWLSLLLWEKTNSADVFRMKGALDVLGSENMFVFQAVHDLYEVFKGRKWREGEERCNKILAIGRNLSASWLETSFKSCLNQ